MPNNTSGLVQTRKLFVGLFDTNGFWKSKNHMFCFSVFLKKNKFKSVTVNTTSQRHWDERLEFHHFMFRECFNSFLPVRNVNRKGHCMKYVCHIWIASTWWWYCGCNGLKLVCKTSPQCAFTPVRSQTRNFGLPLGLETTNHYPVVLTGNISTRRREIYWDARNSQHDIRATFERDVFSYSHSIPIF